MPNGCCMTGADGEEYPGQNAERGYSHDADCWLYNPDGSPKKKEKKMGGDREDIGAEYDDPGLGLDDYNADDFIGGGGGRGKRKKAPDPGYDVGDVEVIRGTDNAILVRGSGLSSDPFGVSDPNEESWVPRSQVHARSELDADADVGAKGKLVISKWLAQQRKLV